MKIITTIQEARIATRQTPVALVPTMGALHEGHLSLIRAARQQAKTVIVSIFVNPTQFAPNEDLAKYPRTFDADVALLKQEGVDLLFAPSVEEMYPRGPITTFVDVPEIADRLDGQSRPGHFRAVATVVAKLFHILQPDIAYFGQKDAAQVAVLRAMVRDLNFSLTLSVCPTVRESDGLALSSRNRYLSLADRTHALTLYAALTAAQDLAMQGTTNASALQDTMLNLLHADPGLRVDYAEVVNPDTLEPVAHIRDGALLAVAAWIGETRLIDNIPLPKANLS